jgi:hypothetical protein
VACGCGARPGVLPAHRRPLTARPWLQVQRPELVHAEDHFWLTGLGHHLTAGDRIRVLHARLLRRIVRSLDAFQGLHPLKADALLAEQNPQALGTDVVDHPLGHQEHRQLGQAPGGKRQIMSGRLGLGDLLDLPPLAQRELRRMPAFVLRVKRAEPVGLKFRITSRTRSSLVNATFAIAGTSMPCADSSTICARRQVTTEPLPPRMIRTSRPPSSSSISRTRDRSVTGPVSRTSARKETPGRGQT